VDALSHGLYLAGGEAGVNGQMQGTACEIIGVRAAAGVYGEEGTAVQRPVSPSH
jgi:hypothetical protein